MARSSIVSTALRFFRKPAFEQRLLVEALILTGWFRLLVLFFPFSVLRRILGNPRGVLKQEQLTWQANGFPEALTEPILVPSVSGVDVADAGQAGLSGIGVAGYAGISGIGTALQAGISGIGVARQAGVSGIGVARQADVSGIGTALQADVSESVMADAAVAAPRAGEVARAVRSASDRTIWESTCLVQAGAAFWMLRRRGVPCRLYLGVRRNTPLRSGMKPHAWLTSGKSVVLGGGELHHYAVVSVFESDA